MCYNAVSHGTLKQYTGSQKRNAHTSRYQMFAFTSN